MTASQERSTTTDGSDEPERSHAKVFMTEAIIGVVIGLCVLAALITGTAEIPFVYQGY